MSWVEAAVVGALQGVAELFPVSSLGHSILLPAVIGGSWARDLDVSSPESPYLAFIVGLHVATALALVIYFWRDWVRIVRGLVSSVVRREVRDVDQRLAWLLVLGTIPVGISGLLLEHTFRTVLSKAVPTAAFLLFNGLILLGGEQLRRRSNNRGAPVVGGRHAQGAAAEGSGHVGEEVEVGEGATGYIDERVSGPASDARLAGQGVGRAVLIAAAQIAALAPGISRSGITMVAGLRAGLSHEDAARFSFLLATPVIAAAGLLKLGDLAGPLGDGIRGQILLGSVLSGVGAYLSVRFLTRYFATRSLRPFGWYCVVVGAACLVWFAVR
ncbi:undecaprenyl-diphosphate phosphatase [Pseudonocardia sp. Cha107L01]|uniref:undecaprenyl-diphosphate phosphatase n=1 Tax=Pseudonocardia sp. Cha107L01 TaxID=3457576 RepID=UPI00403E9D6D